MLGSCASSDVKQAVLTTAGPSWELRRTQLCRHTASSVHDRHTCNYAHSLEELFPPYECRQSYPEVWQGRRVDRFYGQVMTDEQIRAIMQLWERTPPCSRPPWSTALVLLERYDELRAGWSYAWDFGLDHDCRRLHRNRGGGVMPFAWYPDLWARLEERKRFLHREMPGLYYPLGFVRREVRPRVLPGRIGDSAAIPRSPAESATSSSAGDVVDAAPVLPPRLPVAPATPMQQTASEPEISGEEQLPAAAASSIPESSDSAQPNVFARASDWLGLGM